MESALVNSVGLVSLSAFLSCEFEGAEVSDDVADVDCFTQFVIGFVDNFEVSTPEDELTFRVVAQNPRSDTEFVLSLVF